jgi:Arc/MetJ family transcription regulator
MPREKKYTKTIAFRVTAEEWELIAYAMERYRFKNPSTFVRNAVEDTFARLATSVAEDRKLEAARAKRAAKKAAANVVA